MASKSAGLSFEDWHNWSGGAVNYKNERNCNDAWKSFKDSGGISEATLFKMARDKGWRENTNHPRLPIHHPKINAQIKVKHADSINVLQVWNSCIPATVAEPYIHRKGGIADGLRVYPADAPPLIIRGQNIAGYLVVPCWSNDELQTMQFIPPESGDKLNLPSASFNDGYFTVGTINSLIYVTEGLGQTWSCYQATNCAAVNCFGAGRMARVAKVLRDKYPNVEIVIVPDVGKEVQATEIAAGINGRRIHLPEDKPNNYDVNDYAHEFGSQALRDLLNQVQLPSDIQSPTNQQFNVPKLPKFDARDGTANTRPLTELGNAQRLLDANADSLKYVCDAKSWLLWSHGAWIWDSGASVRVLAGELAPAIYTEGSNHISDAAHYARWARKSQEKRTIDAAVSLLSDFDSIRMTLSSIDASHFIVGFDRARQVINLTDGNTRRAHASDYVTKSLGAETIGDAAKAVGWLRFLEQVFNGDTELIDWLQRFCGYLLTGSTREQIFLFCFGHGANGKSVFIEVLKHIIGDYSRAIASESLSDSKRQAGGATADLAALIGTRLVISSETEDNTALAESLVKSLVSGDSMSVRQLYAAPVEFKPNFKLVMAGNHKPIVRGNDNGIWRRVRLVPFSRTFTPEERDPHLLDKLKAETPHILAWMVDGCISWQRQGLADTPTVIKQATDAYQLDQDLIGTWLSECASQSHHEETLAGDLYTNYKIWCDDNGLRPASSTVLGRRLSERGFGRRKSVGKVVWSGLKLTDSRHTAHKNGGYQC
jgi:P4 family phage/plasmid primase-like protien